MSQNLIERIVQRFAVGLDADHLVRAGEYVSIRPAHVLTHDNTSAVIPKFTSLSVPRNSSSDGNFRARPPAPKRQRRITGPTVTSKAPPLRSP